MSRKYKRFLRTFFSFCGAINNAIIFFNERQKGSSEDVHNSSSQESPQTKMFDSTHRDQNLSCIRCNRCGASFSYQFSCSCSNSDREGDE